MKKNNFDLEYEASCLFEKMKENNVPCIILAGMDTSVTGISATPEQLMSLMAYACDNNPELVEVFKQFAANVDAVMEMVAGRRKELMTIVPLAKKL